MESVKESLSFGGQIWRRVYCKLENKEMKSENDIYPHDPLQHNGKKKKKDTLAEGIHIRLIIPTIPTKKC